MPSGESQCQAAQRRDDRACEHQSRHREALRHELSGGQHQGFGQKALIDSLGIKKLKAVAGLSMGGLQAYEWAQSYPDSVDRIVSVVAAASAEPFLIAWMDVWAQPIRLDPKWNNGDYYGKEAPLDGLKAALKIVTLQANGWEWARKTFGTAPAEEGKDPAKALTNEFKMLRSSIKQQ